MSILKLTEGDNGAIRLGSGYVNTLLRARYINTTFPYQRAFNMFDWLTIRANLKYSRKRVNNANGIMWQPYEVCRKTPGGSFSFSDSEVTGCAVSFATEMCNDTWGTCLEHLQEFSADGMSEPNAEFSAMLNEAIANMQSIAANQLLNILFLGQFHSQNGLTPNPSVLGAENVARFTAQEAACEGLLGFLANNIEKCNILGDGNYSDCQNPDDLIAAFERAFCCAEEQFAALVNMGFTGGRDAPYFNVSQNLYKSLRNAYDATKAQYQLNPSLANLQKERIAYDGGTVDVYTYRGIPIVPNAIVNGWDREFGVNTQFIMLSTAGNIQLGSNFGAGILADNEPIGMTIQKAYSVLEENLYNVVSNAVLMTNVVDPNLVVWDFSYIQ